MKDPRCMPGTVVRTMLVDDDLDDVRLIEGLLDQSADFHFSIRHARTVADALELARAGAPIDLLLVELNLPDSRQLETVLHLRNALPSTCIVVHTGVRDDALALAATRAGVQEFLVKGEYEGPAFCRALRCAVERQAQRNGAAAAPAPEAAAVPFYRSFLEEELKRRKARDEFYSLRAYALDLDLHVANVSKVLAGKQSLTLKSAVRAATALRLAADVACRFLASVSAEERSRLVSKQTATVEPVHKR